LKEEGNHHFKYLLTADELAQLVGSDASEVRRSFDALPLIPPGGNKKGIGPAAVRQYLSRLGFAYPFTVIAHINMRGGIGKTISTITAATRACQYGFKTCIIDLDPQGSSSLALDQLPGEEDPIFYDVWQNPGELTMGSLRKIQEHLYILPSSLENALLDASLINPSSQKKAVRGVCDVLKAHGFDTVFIDCPPSLGIAVISTICAADIIVIPVHSDAFSFKGLELTLKEIGSICETFGLRRPRIRILYTKFDRREKIAAEGLRRLTSEYADYFIPKVIRTTTDFSQGLARRETIFASLKKSHAKEDYDYYVRHILGLEGFADGR
jgi:chromosome partitioning protein